MNFSVTYRMPISRILEEFTPEDMRWAIAFHSIEPMGFDRDIFFDAQNRQDFYSGHGQRVSFNHAKAINHAAPSSSSDKEMMQKLEQARRRFSALSMSGVKFNG